MSVAELCMKGHPGIWWTFWPKHTIFGFGGEVEALGRPRCYRRRTAFDLWYPPSPLHKHAKSQENDGQAGSHAWTNPCLRATCGIKRMQ